MFASVVAALALAASVSRVAASPIEHMARGYRQDADILEDYTPYHVRYLALDCQDKHNTQFFDDCCHPLLRWQKLSDRPGKCIPSPSASHSAALAEPSAPTVDEDPIYDDCDDDEPVTSASRSAPPKTEEPPVTTTSRQQHTPSPTPTPTPTPTPVKTTSSAHPTTSAQHNGGGGGEVFKGGFATFFTQDGNAGACGEKHGDDFPLVAADFRRYGPLDKKSDLCGKKVHITNPANGKTVVAVIADACPSCENPNSLDLSLFAFDQIGDRDTGMFPIEWSFV